MQDFCKTWSILMIITQASPSSVIFSKVFRPLRSQFHYTPFCRLLSHSLCSSLVFQYFRSVLFVFSIAIMCVQFPSLSIWTTATVFSVLTIEIITSIFLNIHSLEKQWSLLWKINSVKCFRGCAYGLFRTRSNMYDGDFWWNMFDGNS